jgi:hypothetical protein
MTTRPSTAAVRRLLLMCLYVLCLLGLFQVVSSVLVPTSSPSGQPMSAPSAQPSRQPTSQPSIQPSRQPSSQPSRRPSSQPSRQPTRRPTNPTSRPTGVPSAHPSSPPSTGPSAKPTLPPTSRPSAVPSRQPSSKPTVQPSAKPTGSPTRQPTRQPTSQPSRKPSSQPSHQPSGQPTRIPSTQPTSQPSRQPSCQPSSQPSRSPTTQPSAAPSNQPTSQPTVRPTTSRPSSRPSSAPSKYPTTPSPTIDGDTNPPTSIPTTLPTVGTATYINDTLYREFQSALVSFTSVPSTVSFATMSYKNLNVYGTCPAWQYFSTGSLSVPSDQYYFGSVTTTFHYENVQTHSRFGEDITCDDADFVTGLVASVNNGEHFLGRCGENEWRAYRCNDVPVICVDCKFTCGPDACPGRISKIISPCISCESPLYAYYSMIRFTISNRPLFPQFTANGLNIPGISMVLASRSSVTINVAFDKIGNGYCYARQQVISGVSTVPGVTDVVSLGRYFNILENNRPFNFTLNKF